jgi:hypothetical protein
MVKAQLPFAVYLGFLAVHIKTKRTTIELRRPYVNEVKQSVSQRALLYGITQLKEFPCQFR